MLSPLISVVIIGRNEAKNLARLRKSLEPLLGRWSCETIFVDSASHDDSVAVARTLFDVTVLLADSPHLNASAGRYVGVTMARGEWALFLDGDMEFMSQCLTQLAAHLELEPRDCGAVGTYVHRFSDASVRRWRPSLDRQQRVVHFGGAVLLPMAALRQENWDPRLYSNEEIELYTRLRTRGYGVRRLDVDFISHWTVQVPALQRLVGNFRPHGSFLGKKFFGIGQVLAARLSEGRLASLVRWFPEPFALWSAVFVAALLAASGGRMPALGLLAAVTGAITWRRSWKLVIVYLAFLPQALYGRRHFSADWLPTVAQTFDNRPSKRR